MEERAPRAGSEMQTLDDEASPGERRWEDSGPGAEAGPRLLCSLRAHLLQNRAGREKPVSAPLAKHS